MNWKPTAHPPRIAAALLYVFFAYYEVKQPNTKDATDNAARLTTLDRSDIDGLVITDRDTKIDIRRDVDHWTMKSPLADRADTTLVEQLLTSLETTHKEDTISAGDVSKGKLADYGLQSPHEKLQVIPHDGKPIEYDFGNETAVDGKTYMQTAGQGEVVVVGDEIKKLLQKAVNDWRDHRVTNVAATDVNKFTVKNPAGEIELQRDGEHWKITKPLAARGDDGKINDLVSQVTNLTVSTFVADDKADAASYGLAEPRGTITLYTAKEPKGIALMIGTHARRAEARRVGLTRRRVAAPPRADARPEARRQRVRPSARAPEHLHGAQERGGVSHAQAQRRAQPAIGARQRGHRGPHPRHPGGRQGRSPRSARTRTGPSTTNPPTARRPTRSSRRSRTRTPWTSWRTARRTWPSTGWTSRRRR